jgi:hypothetical protein
MQTNIYETSSPPSEQEKATSAEQWSNWTTNQIRSAIETNASGPLNC